MILHVTFSDGSNPWVFYGDRHQVAREWRRIVKRHPDTAQPRAICGPGGVIYSSHRHRYAVGPLPLSLPTMREYKHLGHALAALERLGGETK